MSAVEGADSWCMSDFCPDQSRGAHNHIEGQTVYRAVEGADTTAALRARLGAIDVYARAGAVTEVKTDAEYLTDALRAVLDLCDVEVEWGGDEGDGPSGYVEVPEIWKAISAALGEGTP